MQDLSHRFFLKQQSFSRLYTIELIYVIWMCVKKKKNILIWEMRFLGNFRDIIFRRS